MSIDFSQYIGHAVTLRKPDGDEGTLLVLEASDLALSGLDIDLNMSNDVWTMIRLPVAGKAGVYKIVNSWPAPRLLAECNESMRGELTNNYQKPNLNSPILTYKASVLELVTSVQQKLKSSIFVESGPLKPMHDFFDEIADTQAEDIAKSDSSDDMTVCLHIPVVIDKKSLARGINIFVQRKSGEE